ncbi:hypothetical protein DFH29DRAFT_998424 [Suillus ampliporus]|nr:hypothetical protein DFH29DRAFT_998424 [Suillus ampliporus]
MLLPDLSLLLHHPIPRNGPALSLLLHHPIPPDGAANFSALVHPRGGAGPSMNLPGPQLPPQNPQPLPPDPQLPLWSPPDTGAQRAPTSTWPSPTSAQHAPPSTLHPPLLIFAVSLPPLAMRWVCWMGGDVDMDDDPSRRRVSLDSPPRLVGQKWQYTASPSPPPVEKNAFLLSRKPQTPTYHSRKAFGSASPGGQVPRKPSAFALSSGDIVQPFHSLIHGIFVLCIDQLSCFANGIPDITVCEAAELILQSRGVWLSSLPLSS